jgi:hypothetical protein
MQTYKTTCYYYNGTTTHHDIKEDDAKESGNVYNHLAKDARNAHNLRRIEVELTNANGGTYTVCTYDAQLERWKENGARIERINPDGYEDYTGYGARTNGKRNRFYIGKSTGWIPCYLEILRKDSHGGGTLSEVGILTVVA